MGSLALSRAGKVKQFTPNVLADKFRRIPNGRAGKREKINRKQWHEEHNITCSIN